MKTQLTLILSFLFISIGSFAQAKTALTTEKIKVWGNCGMCKTTIEKAAKGAGASSAIWNEDAKILTVKFLATKTSVANIEKKVAASGYDTQNETAPNDVYENLHGCCQYDRKATTVIDSTSMSCCKDGATCTKECCTKEGSTCVKDGATCKKDCCSKEKMSCCKAGTTCTKDCCSKTDMSCCTSKDAKQDCCKEGNTCCSK